MIHTYLIIILDEKIPNVKNILTIHSEEELLHKLKDLTFTPEYYHSRILNSSNEIISFGYGNFFAYKLIDKG